MLHFSHGPKRDYQYSDGRRSDIPFFTVKADGTRDPTNTENISVVVRFVKQGKVHEVLVDMTTSKITCLRGLVV